MLFAAASSFPFTTNVSTLPLRPRRNLYRTVTRNAVSIATKGRIHTKGNIHSNIKLTFYVKSRVYL